jgi:hypothetical protein
VRYLKLLFISILFFALLITGISLFFPSHVRISKATDLAGTKDSVMMQLKDAANWKHWYPGADSLRILPVITAVSDSTVICDADKRNIMGWNLYPANTPNMVTVQWYMDFKLRWYPWEKFSSMLLEGRYGPMMEKGLSSLKKWMEK